MSERTTEVYPAPEPEDSPLGAPSVAAAAISLAGETPSGASADSPDAILAEMENPDKDIRKAALEKAVQLDDRSIVPRLLEIAGRTEDLEEKAAILAAADYVNLPSVAEYLDAERSNRVARGQTDRARALTNRFTGRPFVRRQQPQPAP